MREAMYLPHSNSFLNDSSSILPSPLPLSLPGPVFFTCALSSASVRFIMGNPPVTLQGGPPRNAVLPSADGRQFSACLQCALLAANSITRQYPSLLSPDAMEAVRRTPAGQVVLSHLTALAYSYWDTAPAGPGVCTFAARHLVPPVDAVCRDECWMWGTTRLNSEVDERLTIVTETDAGSVVADPSGETFYLVCGLMSSPATAVKRAGVALPATVRLSALPFRGVLVYDGLISGGPPVPVTGEAKTKILAAYEAAKAAGALVTGMHPPAKPASAPPPVVDTADLSAMSVSALKALLRSQGASPDGCVEKGDLVARAAALRASAAAEQAEKDTGGWKNPDGSFKQLCPESALCPSEAAALATLRRARKGSAQKVLIFRRVDASDAPAGAGHNLVSLMDDAGGMRALFSAAASVPTAAELLKQLAKAVARSGEAPSILAADDAAAAAGMDRVTRHAGIHTGLYPRASVEERALLTTIPPPTMAALAAEFQN